MKPKSKKGYCILKRKNPTVSIFEIYESRDVTLNKDEEIWEVIIMPTKKVKVIHI